MCISGQPPEETLRDAEAVVSGLEEHGLAVPLDRGAIHVWRVALDAYAGVPPRLDRTLSDDERDRAARFRSPDDRRRFIVGRGMLRLILSRYLAVPPEDLRFRYGEHGKPELDGQGSSNDIRFNLAHSNGVAVYAVTRGQEVGVDVERVRSWGDLEAVAERFFTPSEWFALRGLPPRERDLAFFSCWTLKEAVLKAVGNGLTQHLDSFAVTVRPDEPAAFVAVAPGGRGLQRWKLERLDLGEGYVGALCVEPPVCSIRYCMPA
ncbi:MAG TPA: 4'-phosphopantetheinyl transferase superfamily protein [Gemmatimonadales bacterium]|nr:4'-phosphopantetheinyl transferase superfamily protein [Gemmatimonadales bacterium]